MAASIRDVMTTEPLVLDATQTVAEAATIMRDADVGDVLVRREGKVVGIVTDRDVVARVVADGLDPASTQLGEVCSGELHTLSSDATVGDAIALLRAHAVRRIPILDGDDAVGIVSIGDLAMRHDPESALADISAAAPNT